MMTTLSPDPVSPDAAFAAQRARKNKQLLVVLCTVIFLLFSMSVVKFTGILVRTPLTPVASDTSPDAAVASPSQR
jgi:hypothetical protein